MSVSAPEGWAAEDVRVDDVERALAELRGGAAGSPELRTSVMTLVAWVPPEWWETARATLAELGERYPSRTILLLPRPEDADGLDARVETQCFPAGGDHHVATEVVELTLRGARAAAAGSVVAPLLLSDLPVFLRWRGEPPFGEPTFQRLVPLVDRLVVDSREWERPAQGYSRLAELFGDHLAVSDIAWARTFPWRERIARQWPGVAGVRRLGVRGREQEALLLAGWLRSRLRRRIVLEHQAAGELEQVEVDGRPVEPPAEAPASRSDLLSAELDRFARDPVYEAAVLAARD